ncbi:MAG: DUF4173 domain-containing protein [Clostridiaceae bacterium]|nr:DUF4173 domain-containing protein [Clostridiaceae bacterium]
MKKYLYILRNNNLAYLICEKERIKYFEKEKDNFQEIDNFLRDKLSCELIKISDEKQVEYFGEEIKVVLVDIIGLININDNEAIKPLNNIAHSNLTYMDLKLIKMFCYFNNGYNLKGLKLEYKEKKFAIKNLILSAIIAIISTLFLVNNNRINYLGISVPIVVILIVTFGMILMEKKEKINPLGIYFLIIAIFLSGTYGIFTNIIFRTINLILIPISIISGLSIVNMPKISVNFKSLVFNVFNNIFESVFSSSALSLIAKALVDNRGKEKQENKQIKGIKQGILISIPILIILIMLLCSADEVFASIFVGLKRIISNSMYNLNTVEIMLRLILISIIFYCISALYHSLNDKTYKEYKIYATKIDKNMANTILIMINVLYIFFTFIQVKYLYIKQEFKNFTPEMYSDYARSGFFQLIVVVVLNILIILFFYRMVEDNRLTNVLNTIMTIISINMCITSMYKMSLYIGKYGMTRLRFMSSFFMIFLLVCLLFILISIWKKVNLFKWCILSGSIIYLIMNFINMDKIIVSYNLNADGVEKDNEYLISLSLDAYDEIEKAYKEGKIDNIYFDRYKRNKEYDVAWYEYNYYRNK